MTTAGTASSPESRLLSRKKLLVGSFKVLLAFALVYPPIAYFESRYIIGVDPVASGMSSTPYRFYLIDTNDRDLRRGDYFAFNSRGMGPFYGDGIKIVKQLVGVDGDHISVASRVSVNGEAMGELPHVQPREKLWYLGKRPADYIRDLTLSNGQYWAMGSHPRSFDSRYWGPVLEDQVIGRAYAIF
ncbi:MAG: S26 family signal peptidase [Gammaproteobacteria bacterium]